MIQVTLMYIFGFAVGIGVAVASTQWSDIEFACAIILALIVPPSAHALFRKVEL